MSNKITIRNLKHIRELTFDVPPPGVHLLSGANGAGKTSVLACLRRIGQGNAFAQHFRASQYSDSLDNFDGAEIVYCVNGREVTYAYGGERWVPRPRSNNRLLSAFGYPSVFYIGATADRITPRPEDFNVRRVAQAPLQLREAANRILGTNKFDALKTINLTRGGGNSAFVLQSKPAPGAKYVSERNFSLGELCILKLVRELMYCANNSLVLIDELELALHPRAQIELLRYLQEMAEQKRLTVIFSTHSVSLLKRVPREQILFLEASNGAVTTVKGCYPTYALGNIAYDEERAPDLVIYVEDESALYATEALARLSISHRFRNEVSLFPTVHVVPIGPFISVVRFLARSRALLPPTTVSVALLDNDVKTETIAGWRAQQNHAALAEFQAHERTIDYLPWTPEVGLVEYLGNGGDAQLHIRQHFNNHHLQVRPQDIGDIPPAAGGEQRRACKAAVQRVVRHIAGALPNESEVQVQKALFQLFSKWHFDKNRASVLQLFGPLLTQALVT
ncbi:ATP-binding protein [Paraburkholderia sprentiae WSM5005]|uniref:ATP-binding protein n=1 Tax=Paraburkholderia sprentiae WSM5005 TaxID=754502 RepID=A0A1I9YSW5_9BURK|nr:AAA family ATPase [Paraburkholderia sprentiae]APA89286.1 ATP-binding protein [Paraburkholderia sprentiae WSM5005]